MLTRIGQFIIFTILTVGTLGVYALYFVVTRQAEANRLQRTNNKLVARQVELLEMAILPKKKIDTAAV